MSEGNAYPAYWLEVIKDTNINNVNDVLYIRIGQWCRKGYLKDSIKFLFDDFIELRQLFLKKEDPVDPMFQIRNGVNQYWINLSNKRIIHVWYRGDKALGAASDTDVGFMHSFALSRKAFDALKKVDVKEMLFRGLQDLNEIYVYKEMFEWLLINVCIIILFLFLRI